MIGISMAPSLNHFGVVGAGAWGTALSLALTRAERSVSLWAYESDVADGIREQLENKPFLPGIPIPNTVRITHDLADLSSCTAFILATPAQHLRATCKALAPRIKTSTPLIIASKGIETGTYRLMSEVVAEEIPNGLISVLSGPSFAKEVAQGLPTALTLASEHNAEDLACVISSPTLRPYTSDDIIGTQIGGAVKNALAIACGIVSGRKLGENARAALITRGLAEIVRLGVSLGARMETLMGLSGLGDLVLTCSSTQSRNMSLGFALGQGKELKAILAERICVTEGISTAAATLGLARRHGVEMPVVSAVDLVLRDQATIEDSITALLARPLRNETL